MRAMHSLNVVARIFTNCRFCALAFLPSQVAHVLLSTMRPLKKVLREQQVKIEKLEKQKEREKHQEEKMAAALADKLKTGLLSHLKRDVDIEVSFARPFLVPRVHYPRARLREPHKLTQTRW